jgi:hypothetical protein
MARPNFYITEADYRAAVGLGNWQIQDLPPDIAEALRPFLNNEDTLGVFASGTFPPVRDERGYVAGMDWVRHEPEDRRRQMNHR